MLKFYLRKMWKYGRVKLFVFCQCIPHGLNFLWNPQFVWSKKISRWPSFQVPNWDQVNQLFSKFQRNLLISKISLKLIEYFVYLVPVCGGIRRLGHCEILSLHTNWGFQKKFSPWGIHWQNTRSFTRPDFLISSSFGQKWRKRNWHD